LIVPDPPGDSSGPPTAEEEAPPGWRGTLTSGILPVLWQGSGPRYWLVMTAAIATTLMAGFTFLRWQAQVVPGFFGIGPGMITLFSLAFFSPMLGIALAYAAACFHAVLQDTANGADEIHHWPEGAFGDKLGLLLYTVYHLGLAAGLSYGLAAAVGMALGPGVVFWGTVAGLLFFYPIFAISSLISQQPMVPLSGEVLGSFRQHPVAWLLVYTQMGVPLGLWAYLVRETGMEWPFATAVYSSPGLAAWVLVGGRLLGRLTWLITYRELTEDDVRPTPYERVVRPLP